MTQRRTARFRGCAWICGDTTRTHPPCPCLHCQQALYPSQSRVRISGWGDILSHPDFQPDPGSDGGDDTDLYARLQEPPRGLRRTCVNYSMLRHNGAGHAPRGETWVTEFMHRRAVTAVWQQWQSSRLLPSSWAPLVRRGGVALRSLALAYAINLKSALTLALAPPCTRDPSHFGHVSMRGALCATATFL